MTLKGGAQWTIATAREYLSFQTADPWAGYWTARQTLAAGMKTLGFKPSAQAQRRRRDKARCLPVCCASAAASAARRAAARDFEEPHGRPLDRFALPLGFGLVSIPVKLYSATESSATVRFNMLAKDGSRLKQQYVSEKDSKVVERAEMVKGYEFEKDRFVIFQPEELKALQESPSHTIDIVAFIPEKAVDPIFYDKAYFLAPDKRGGKPYKLLMAGDARRAAAARWPSGPGRASSTSCRCAPAEDGLVLQQLLYADEVRSLKELDIEKVTVSAGRAQAGAAADRADLRGHLRPDDVRGRGEEAHPRRDRREDRRQADRRQRAGRAAGRRPGDRPDGGAARQPGQARRRPRARPRRRKAARPAAGAGRGGQGAQGRQARAPRCEEAAAAPARARAKK